jgi:hypothetical protein
VCAVQDSTPSLPYLTLPLERERSVAQLTVALDPTTSVRYG